MPTRRQSRVAEQIHRDLSSLLMFEVHDPRLVGITLTGVEVTPDLQLAHIHYTLLGSEEERAQARSGLEHAKGFLRTRLAGQLGLRLMPVLVFHVDKSAEYGRRIDELLDSLPALPAGSPGKAGDHSSNEPGPA